MWGSVSLNEFVEDFQSTKGKGDPQDIHDTGGRVG